MANKSGIHIKKSKVGSLRKHLGTAKGKKIPASQLTIKKGDSKAIRKKKIFAQNARKWSHEDGGYLVNPLEMPQYGFGGTLADSGGKFSRIGNIMGGVGKAGNFLGNFLPFANLAGSLIGGIGSLLNARKQSKLQEETIADQNKATELANQEAAADAMAQARIAGLGTPTNYAPVAAKGGYLNYLGQSHKGPAGGIMVDENGNPTVVSKKNPVASVEGGELAVSLDGEPYVYSKQLGYADEANKIIKRFTRGGSINKLDKMASDAMYKKLGRLRDDQEEINDMGTDILAKGGSLSAAKAGKMLKEGKANKHPLTEKQKKLFRAVAHGWKPTRMKEGGGYLPTLQDGGDPITEWWNSPSKYGTGLAPRYRLRSNLDALFGITNNQLKPWKPFDELVLEPQVFNPTNTVVDPTTTGVNKSNIGWMMGGNREYPATTAPTVATSTKRVPGSTPALTGISGIQYKSPMINPPFLNTITGEPMTNTKQYYNNYNQLKGSLPTTKASASNQNPTLSPLGHILSGASGLATYAYLKKHRPALLKAIKFPRVAAEHISYAPERLRAQQAAGEAEAVISGEAKRVGLTGAQAHAGISTGITGVHKLLGEQVGASLEREVNTNAGMRQQANIANAQLASQEAQAQAQTEVYNALLQNQYQQQLGEYNPASMLSNIAAKYFADNASQGLGYDTLRMLSPNAQLGSAPNFLPWLIGKKRNISFKGEPLKS